MTFETLGRQVDFVLAKAASLVVAYANQAVDNFAVRSIEGKKRDEISGLLKLSDGQLQDMGISRDDVRMALTKPLDFNSGRYLEGVRRNSRKL